MPFSYSVNKRSHCRSWKMDWTKQKTRHIYFNDFIRSCSPSGKERGDVCIRQQRFIIYWNGNECVQSCTKSYFSIEYSICVQWPKATDMQYNTMRQLKLPLEFKAYWSFWMTSDLTCMETYKNVKTMHYSETWIKLHWFLYFASTRHLPKTCPTLNWDQAPLSFSSVNRF